MSLDYASAGMKELDQLGNDIEKLKRYMKHLNHPYAVLQHISKSIPSSALPKCT